MELTITTNVSVDGVMQGLGGSEEDRRGGFERGGWALPLLDAEAGDHINEVYGGAAAFLFGRRTYEIFAGSWGTLEEMRAQPVGVAPAPDAALDLVSSRATSGGITIQTYRRAGRPQYATATPGPST